MAQRVVVCDLSDDRVPEAIRVLSRGMRDNPLHLAAFGEDPDRRRRALERVFTALARVMTEQQIIGALDGDTVVGVTGVAPPGTCQPRPVQSLRLAPMILALGPGIAGRMLRWVSTWARRDPDEPHVHYGAFAVDAHLQGRGIGSQILAEHCRRLDAEGTLAYLETDRPENVRLYERFGYRVVGEGSVIDVPNWFMRREPGAS